MPSARNRHLAVGSRNPDTDVVGLRPPGPPLTSCIPPISPVSTTLSTECRSVPTSDFTDHVEGVEDHVESVEVAIGHRPARHLLEAVLDIDVRDALPVIQSPTLIHHWEGDRLFSIEVRDTWRSESAGPS